MSSWRLINTGFLTAPENMAIDESLLANFDPDSSPPILRLYGWDPPALSIGRFQDAAAQIDLERCRMDLVPLVRRITGGGAIYHSDELTYSVVCSSEQIGALSTVKESFRALTGFILEFYRKKGFEAAYAADIHQGEKNSGERVPYCFAGREAFDILIRGRKIGGNAQRRERGIIFQHGSIPMINRSLKGLSYMRDKRAELVESTVSIAECLGVCPAVAADFRFLLAEELKESFCSSFSTTLFETPLSPDEKRKAASLLGKKYLDDRWNIEGMKI